MCIISILPKGKEKLTPETIKFITNGYNNNQDGSGYMYKRNNDNKIFISKGITNLNQLLEEIESHKLGIDDELIIHHRIGNVGKVIPEMTHPFICVNSEDCSKLSGYVDKPCLVHNGTLMNIIDFKGYNPNYSDTYAFSRYIMSDSNIVNLMTSNTDLFKRLFRDILNVSKLAFLLPDKDMVKIGEFIADNGYFHSNDGYKDGWYRDVGGKLVNATKQTTIGFKQTNQSSQSNETHFTKKINDILNKKPLSLDYSVIYISKFNYDKFIYKDSVDDIYEMHDIEYTNNLADSGKHYKCTLREIDLMGNRKTSIYCKVATVECNYDMVVKTKYVTMYREYLVLLRDLIATKSNLKRISKKLNNSRNKPLDYELKVGNIKASRLAFIEFYIYYYCEINGDLNGLLFEGLYSDTERKLLSPSEREAKLLENNKKNDFDEIVGCFPSCNLPVTNEIVPDMHPKEYYD